MAKLLEALIWIWYKENLTDHTAGCMTESRIHAADVQVFDPLCCPYKKLLAKTLSQTLTAAGNLEVTASYLGAVQRSSWAFWKWGSSGASHVVLDGRMYATLLQSHLGNLTTLGTLPSMRITNMMLWWVTNAGEKSKGGKSAAYVSHNTDATSIF